MQRDTPFMLNNTMQTLTEFCQKQSATFMKIQTYQVIDDADCIGLSFKMPFKSRYNNSKR